MRCRRRSARVEVLEGNLLSRDDCRAAASGAAVIFHLAAGRGEKSFPDAFMNSVVTTRNLLDAARAARHACGGSSTSVRSRSTPASRAARRACSTSRARLEDRAGAPRRRLQLREGQAGRARRRLRASASASRTSSSGRATCMAPATRRSPAASGIGTFGIFLHLGGSEHAAADLRRQLRGGDRARRSDAGDRRRSVQRRGRRPSVQQAVSASLQAARQAVPIDLPAARR